MERGELNREIHKRPEELEHEADAARAELEHTLEALEERLSPSHLIDQTVDRITTNGGHFGRKLGAQVRDNPLPALLTGVGIAWLMGATSGHSNGGSKRAFQGMSSSARSAASSARSAASSTRAGARSAMHGARSTAHGIAQSTRSAAGATSHAAHSVASAARSHAERVQHGYSYLREEQPLALGAVAIAAGALAGALLAPTRTEDRFMGEASDEAARRLDSKGRAAVEDAEQRLSDAARAATDSEADASTGAPSYRSESAYRSGSESEPESPPGSTPAGRGMGPGIP